MWYITRVCVCLSRLTRKLHNTHKTAIWAIWNFSATDNTELGSLGNVKWVKGGIFFPNSAGSFYPIAQNRVTQIESSVLIEKTETGVWERWLEFSPRVPEKNNLYREVQKPAEECLWAIDLGVICGHLRGKS